VMEFMGGTGTGIRLTMRVRTLRAARKKKGRRSGVLRFAQNDGLFFDRFAPGDAVLIGRVSLDSRTAPTSQGWRFYSSRKETLMLAEMLMEPGAKWGSRRRPARRPRRFAGRC